ncbi:DUF4274 domain-containing protein [Paenibacillus aceris]|uniref:DUF4274 domain-containing protein n=1 Tax=Paenibacillus aceris TaxID=869555 RepID=A0ABS4HQD4_9BACL|nr:DUF4274 domain-containing protein [Paenibacillus aceris]MBP1960827.1 hypothetical protein [Paenibacillus aceris]NHW35495.1 DUF4274 domain-containing protein [Paenibacillus aceris]
MSSTEWITELLENENPSYIKQAISRIENPELLHAIALNYYWDNGFEVPNWIVENGNCEFGTALLLFYRADGYVLLKNNKDMTTGQTEWVAFVSNLLNKLIKNHFSISKVPYEPELTKVQKYKLKKANPNIPEIIFDGV